MRASLLRAGRRARRHLRRGALVIATTVYCVGAVWLAVVIARSYTRTAAPQASAARAAPALQAPSSSPPPPRSSALSLTSAPPGDTDFTLTDLRARNLLVPVEGEAIADLRESFGEMRGTHRHEAIDILAPRGTPVLAVEGGRIARLFFSDAGGNTIYHFDPSERYCYYYAHLDAYAAGLHEGDQVARGQVIGYVGTSGNAPKDTPHLHFAISVLGSDKRWWEGTPLDPFAVWRP